MSTTAPDHNANRTTGRSMRIPDDVWDAAQDLAKERGDSVSEFVRYQLVRYVTNPPRRRFPAPKGKKA